MNDGFDVSAVIPARNGMPDVLDAVDSVLAQTRPSAGVVVVDDASTDGTGAAVSARFGDRVRVVSGRFGSAGAARNAGWRAARSTWVAFLDADDLWFPDKLETAAARLRAHPSAEWFFSDGAFLTLEGETKNSWLADLADVPDPYVGQPVGELFDVNFILTSSVIVRRSALEATSGFDESMSHAEDVDLWIRLARRGPVVGCARPLVRYQHRPGGLTRQVESRLNGNVVLYSRLGDDATLEAGLRDRARRREGMALYKLAVAALREGRRSEARSYLTRSFGRPGRLVPSLLAYGLSVLPPSVLSWVRASGWAKRNVASPMMRLRRVSLESQPGSGDSPALATTAARGVVPPAIETKVDRRAS